MLNEKELLEQLVAESNSYAEILRKLGKSNSGAATRLLKQKLDDYEIIHYFIKEKEHKPGQLIPLEEILVENRPYSSDRLKSRLIKEGLKQNKCEICGITEWQGLPITCQLHHVDGDNTNNCIENLQILCPNCHSQTDTYCSSWKNHKKRRCKICGKYIENKANYCSDCFHIIHRKVNRPTQQELEDDFKKLHSFVQVGKKYNVSDTCIRKWCKYYNWWPDK